MFFIARGDWLFALVLFVIANVGVAGSIVFYDSLLPHIVREEELDRVSTAGYALGYLGGGVLLAINIVMMANPSWFFLSEPRRRGPRQPRQRGGLVGRCSRFRSSARFRSRTPLQRDERPGGLALGAAVTPPARRRSASCAATARPSCCSWRS